jgi:uncharacterized protein YehS (DUF1456 family)
VRLTDIVKRETAETTRPAHAKFLNRTSEIGVRQPPGLVVSDSVNDVLVFCYLQRTSFTRLSFLSLRRGAAVECVLKKEILAFACISHAARASAPFDWYSGESRAGAAMARADLLKKLFTGYQRRDDQAFRQAAEDLIVEERKKQHSILANELERILRNGHAEQAL